MTNKKEYTDIKLEKTDYDNFKNLKFFIEQHKKAKQMIAEVSSFYESFINSKLLTIKQLVKQNFPLIRLYKDEENNVCWGWNIYKIETGLFINAGYRRDLCEKRENLESKITREFNIQIKKGLEHKDIEYSLNDKFSGSMYNILTNDVPYVNRFLVCHTNDIKLLHIPHDTTSEFGISVDETILQVTFTNVKKYKKFKTPGWLPWTVDTTTYIVLFDTTTNNYLSHSIKFATHEEQSRENRGY